MPKSSKKQINEDEKKFLRVYGINSGDSIENIAKNCGFSRQKVWRIKKRLEKSKTVWGYHAVVDDEKLDRTRYMMLVKRSSQPVGDAINKITKLTAGKKGEEIGIDVLSVGYMYGEYDVVIVFTADGIKNAKKFKEILISEVPNLIRKLDLMEYVFLLRDGGITNPEIEKMREFF
ncbi:transcriptional regulator [Thermoplasmatales archaeon SCGC AB-540-F20]|nr:transcriptional regulator [Thermoplasmatales archaeon SCGC AB-540-F20]